MHNGQTLCHPYLRHLAAIILSLLIAPAAWAQQAAPVATVEQLHQTLLQVMQAAHSLGYQGRLQTLEPALASAYDYGQMTRSASGSKWKTMSPDQQQRLTSAFADMSAATYAARFNNYTGEKFVTTGATDVPGGVLVKTELLRPNDQPVQLDYLLKRNDQGWRIVDVYYMGGISEVANQRSQFLSILRSQGPEDLITTLEQKAQQQQAAR